MEKVLIEKIEKGMHRIRKQVSSKQRENLGKAFNQLKTLNEGMYIDLLEQYKQLK